VAKPLPQIKQTVARRAREYFNQRPINNLTKKVLLIIYTWAWSHIVCVIISLMTDEQTVFHDKQITIRLAPFPIAIH